MSKAARGTKRICKSCSGKFYDLNRDPIVCPLCGAVYVIEGTAAPKEEPPAVPEPAEAKEPESEVPAEAPAEAPAAAGEPELVSLQEVQAEEDEPLPAIEEGDELVDLEEDSEEIPANDSEDTFLEEDDEPEPDMSGIIGGGPIKPAEES